MRLLIAEDTKDLNRVITVMLEHAGYDVDSVFDGEAALELLDTNGYDAVILDIMMPKVDGITVLLTPEQYRTRSAAHGQDGGR